MHTYCLHGNICALSRYAERKTTLEFQNVKKGRIKKAKDVHQQKDVFASVCFQLNLIQGNSNV